MTLFEKLGGEAAVDLAVDRFYERVLQDDRINHFFASVDMVKQREHQKAFFTYAFGGTDRPAGEVGSMVFLDSLYTDGYGVNFIARLHLDGFANSTTTALDNHKVSVSPNPTSTKVNLELSLDKTASEVQVNILDFTGRLVSSRTLDNVQKGRYSFDVSKFPNGTYFMSINTPEGFRSKKFQVVR